MLWKPCLQFQGYIEAVSHTSYLKKEKKEKNKKVKQALGRLYLVIAYNI